MSIPTYLVKNRFGIYSYRLITPIAIRKLFPAFKAEVRLTTRSRSVRQATRIAAYFHYHYQTFFEQIKQQGKIMDDWLDEEPSVRQITPALEVDEHIQELTNARILMSLIQRNKEIDLLCELYSDFCGEAVSLSDFKLNTPDDIECLVSIAQIFSREDVIEPELYFKKLKLKPRSQRQPKKDEALKSVSLGGMSVRAKNSAHPIHAIDDVATDDEYRALKRFTREQLTHIVIQVMKDNKAGKPSSFVIDRGGDEIVFSDIQIDDVSDLDSLSTMLESFTPPTLVAQAKQEPQHQISFSQFAKSFLAQRVDHLAAKQNRTHAQAAMDLFIDYFRQDPMVHEVSREMAREILGVLKRLPPNRNIRKATKNLPLEELLKRKWKPTLQEGGISKYLTNYRSFFDYAIKEGYAVENPFDKLSALKKKRIRAKEAANKSSRRFSNDELKAIFSTSVFTTQASRSYYFWVPLLCLYTGGRVSEMAQLDVSDIIKKDGIWCIDINERAPDKSLKNEPSERVIPVHQDLIDIGFIRYVETVKAAASNPKTAVYRTPKLWWDIYTVDGKYSNACEKSLKSVFKKASINRKGDKFHGFRHSLTYMLKSEYIDETTYGAILGHDISMRSGGLYGDRVPLKVMKHALDKVKPLPQDVIDSLKPYALPKTLLPTGEWKRFQGKKYLADLTKEITDKRLLEKIASWQ